MATLARPVTHVRAGLDTNPVSVHTSPNDSAFINESLIECWAAEAINFARSRPYRKNDQTWIERKNGVVVRRSVGYSRYSGAIAGQTLAHLYSCMRLYINYVQPSFKLLRKERQGAPAALTCEASSTSEMECILDEFLAQLPRLWEKGEVRPTHQPAPTKTRDWLTRKDLKRPPRVTRPATTSPTNERVWKRS